MKVELKDAKVELEVGDGKSSLYINGHCIDLPKVVGVRLIFGEDVEVPPTQVKAKPKIPTKTDKKEVRRGCQSPASKRKLSASLKKYHAKKRRKEKAEEKAKLSQPVSKQVTTKKHTSSKSPSGKYLNGSNTHHVN